MPIIRSGNSSPVSIEKMWHKLHNYVALVLCVAYSNGKITMLFNPKRRMHGLTCSVWAGYEIRAILDFLRHDYYH